MRDLRVTKRTPTYLEAEATPGCSLEVACEGAARIAAQAEICVVFDFNGIQLTAKPGDTRATLEASYEAEIARKERANSRLSATHCSRRMRGGLAQRSR